MLSRHLGAALQCSVLTLAAFMGPWHALGNAQVWWQRPWREQTLPVIVAGRNYRVVARRVGRGPLKLFCVQGGPGDSFWDLNFLAVYLDLARYEVIQYNPLGSFPSDCSRPEEPCANDTSWMDVEGFVATLEQVHRALGVPNDAILIAHGFGVVQALEFLRQSMPKQRVAGAVLSDWVPSQAQAARRRAWCDSTHWRFCDVYTRTEREPWHRSSPSQPLLTTTIWGPHCNGTGGVMQGWDIREHLSQLWDTPTISLVGGNDIVFPLDVWSMSRQLNGEYGLLIGAGHFSFTDQLDRWLTLFQSWVESNVLPGGDTDKLAVRMVRGRRYLLRLPSGYDVLETYSLVVCLHGLGGTPEDAPFFSETARTSSKVIFVFPEGLGDSPRGASFRTWNGSGSVGSPGPSGPTCVGKMVKDPHCFDSCELQGGCRDRCWLTTCADDVAFVQSILDDVQSSFSIDPGSMHAVGFSGGGWMAVELGTNPRVAQRFRSIVTISGVPFRGFNKPPAVLPGTRFLGIYGRADSIVPAFPRQLGSTETLASTGWMFNTWENTTQLWASTLGCGQLRRSAILKPATGAAECFDYACPNGTVAVCLWEGAHEVPPWGEDLVWQVLFPDADAGPAPAGPLSSRVSEAGVGVIAAALAVSTLAYLQRTHQRRP
eukprot:CAMPEP_0179047262 /NCGR_PEP_ID=MMETSP0796-20121207/19109_1 /TAXON_ID=73915 /ORGANISM="Pyrodinium bahamense, Strain pbaha01" /LENGTH=655 /DNA_ID=CAMNT_0020743707 /DNA_START=10 /DNA_END=1977 /DNA_ORIENTATION=+